MAGFDECLKDFGWVVVGAPPFDARELLRGNRISVGIRRFPTRILSFRDGAEIGPIKDVSS